MSLGCTLTITRKLNQTEVYLSSTPFDAYSNYVALLCNFISYMFMVIMLWNFLCRNNAFLVNLHDMESYEVSLNDANNNK